MSGGSAGWQAGWRAAPPSCDPGGPRGQDGPTLRPIRPPLKSLAALGRPRLQGGPDQAHPTTQEATGQGERQARACPEALPPGRPRALAAVQSLMIISVVIIMNDAYFVFGGCGFSGQAARASERQETS